MSGEALLGLLILVAMVVLFGDAGSWLSRDGRKCPDCTGGKRWKADGKSFTWCKRCDRTGFIIRKGHE